MYLQKSVYEYAPTIMLLLVLAVYSSLVVIRIIKRERLKKHAVECVHFEVEKIEKILRYYSYECFLVDYYSACNAASELITLHRNYAKAMRRVLVYAGVEKGIIDEYEKRKVERL